MDENKVNDVSTEDQAQVEAEVVEETAAEVEKESTGAQEEVVIEKKQKTGFVGFIKNCFSRKNIKKTIAVILLVLIAGGAAGAYFHYTSPESIALRYTKAFFLDDASKASKMLAYDQNALLLYASFESDEESFFASQSDRLQEDIYSWDDLYEAIKEQRSEKLEDYFGDYKVTYDVKRSKEISERKILDDYADEISYREKADVLDADLLSKGKIVVVKGKIDSEDEGLTRFYNTVVLVKSSDSWKVLTCDFEAELDVLG